MAILFSGSTVDLPVKHCSRCGRELLYFRRPHFERREIVTESGAALAQDRTEVPMLARCECEIARERRTEEQRVAREKQEWIDRCIKHGKIDPRFAGSRFEDWEHSPATEAAYQAAMKCAQEVSADEQDCGLIILGGVGNGKNTLGACICRYVAEHYRTFAYQSVPGLLQSLRDTYDSEDGERESSILRALTGCDLLVLNDWGAEQWTEWTESKMYYIVDSAYGEKRNIVITTNAVKMRREEGDPPGSALSDLMSVRIYDRLLQMCHWVTNEGGSYRRKTAKEAGKGK
jgi:DNA replication protein DnaC